MLKGLKEATSGMKLVNTDKIHEQGRRAYRMGIDVTQNPFKTELQRNVWDKGWKDARNAWHALLKRNEGSLTGLRNLTYRSA